MLGLSINLIFLLTLSPTFHFITYVFNVVIMIFKKNVKNFVSNLDFFYLYTLFKYIQKVIEVILTLQLTCLETGARAYDL